MCTSILVTVARVEGWVEGRDEGRCAAQDEAAATLLALAERASAERQRQRDDVGALALQVVRKLIGSFAPDAVLTALADTATAELLPQQPVALFVHPDHADAVRIRLATAPVLRCEVRADPMCAADACRLETTHGSVDVALEAQLARLAAAWGVTQPESSRACGPSVRPLPRGPAMPSEHRPADASDGE